MSIYFTCYLIPVVALALALFWLVLRDDRRRLWLIVLASLAVLALLHPIFAVIAVALLPSPSRSSTRTRPAASRVGARC